MMTELLGWLELLAMFAAVMALNITLGKLYWRRWGRD